MQLTAGGYRSRKMQCSSVAFPPQLVQDELCPRMDLALAHFGGLQQDCLSLPRCAGPIYRYTAWSECSKTCGGGDTSRAIECIGVDSKVVSEDECVRGGAQAIARELRKQCNTQACQNFEYTTSDWGTCTKSCGGGVRMRKLLCKTTAARDGGFVPESMCEDAGIAKPSDDLRQPCSEASCPELEYRPSDWTRCSRDCGGGVQTRILDCYSKVREDWVRVSDRECRGNIERPKVSTLQDCNMEPCQTYMWKVTDFSECSSTCGPGLKTRELVCMDTKGNSAASEARCAALVRPSSALTEDCTMTPCMTYMWRLSGWTKCSATCDGGEMTRELTCHDAKGDETDGSRCNQLLKPTAPLRLACATQPCITYAWDCTEWGKCNVECGYGTHTRSCTCLGSDDKTYRDDMCPEARCTTRFPEDCGKFVGSMAGGVGTKPLEVEWCNSGKICMSYTYSVSPWCTQDTDPCKQRMVLYSRSATCIGPTGQPSNDRRCAGQGISPKTSYTCDADEVAQEMYCKRCGPCTEAPTALTGGGDDCNSCVAQGDCGSPLAPTTTAQAGRTHARPLPPRGPVSRRCSVAALCKMLPATSPRPSAMPQSLPCAPVTQPNTPLALLT